MHSNAKQRDAQQHQAMQNNAKKCQILNEPGADPMSTPALMRSRPKSPVTWGRGTSVTWGCGVALGITRLQSTLTL